ncbi:hypothetical protein BRADI_5g02830v3 [Brachypodium distachyon]|uniref:Uncharacterized protein n=1 Tax=Brachypodium distachyon TaxID=15368 RepID=A0A0Q3NZB4_BRADI|nr:hypothetical protein BRADI_5g02830v3 [Brachypodium distachyon]
MKLGMIMVAGLIFINLCTCMPRNVVKHGSEDRRTVPQEVMRNLMAGTDGRNGPPSNDHQCPLGTYPNCEMSQNTQRAAQDVGGS